MAKIIQFAEVQTLAGGGVQIGMEIGSRKAELMIVLTVPAVSMAAFLSQILWACIEKGEYFWFILALALVACWFVLIIFYIRSLRLLRRRYIINSRGVQVVSDGRMLAQAAWTDLECSRLTWGVLRFRGGAKLRLPCWIYRRPPALQALVAASGSELLQQNLAAQQAACAWADEWRPPVWFIMLVMLGFLCAFGYATGAHAWLVSILLILLMLLVLACYCADVQIIRWRELRGDFCRGTSGSLQDIDEQQ